MNSRVVITECADYIFWELFLRRLHINISAPLVYLRLTSILKLASLQELWDRRDEPSEAVLSSFS